MTANQIAYQNMLIAKDKAESEIALNREKTKSARAQAELDQAQTNREMYFKYGDKNRNYNPDVGEWIDYNMERGLKTLKDIFPTIAIKG